MRTCVFLSCLGLLASSAAAQTLYRADLHGGAENPPVVTDACGWATVILNPDDTVTYDVRTIGVTGTAAHIHDGDVGVNGPVRHTLSGGPSVWSGTTAAVSAGELADLRAGGLYINVHSSGNPGGEIRGQIEIASRDFSAHLTGGQENPPVATAAQGDASVTLNADDTLTYDVTTTGLTGTAAHIHIGDAGVNGGVVFTLSGGPSDWSGTTAALTSDQIDTLQAEGYYINVHTAGNPGGEIRGQVLSDGVPFFDTPDCAAVSLAMNGAVMQDGTLTTTITGGEPNTLAWFVASLDRGLTDLFFEPFLLDLGQCVSDTFMVTLDGSGELTFDTPIGPQGGTATIYVQVFNVTATATNGAFEVSNGVELAISDLQ